MAVTTLGKRTRSSRELDCDLPSKRVRRQTRSFLINDENRDPAEDAQVDDTIEEETSFKAITTLKQDVRPKTTSKKLNGAVRVPITPSTPRFRDVFSSSPVTPRHRVMSVGKASRRLTPQTPVTPASCPTVYQQARQLFARSSDPGQLIGRDEERSQLNNFLERCSSTHPSGCLYVSGPPGTGKSAMVNAVTEEVAAAQSSVRRAYINCMSIKSSNDLYTTLLELLEVEVDDTENDAAAALQKLFVPKKKGGDVYLVVLDEIDHILTLDLESLYRVFEWSMQKTSRLALVGIANALDLTDRFLPRLKARNLKPELLPFLPYSAAQVKTIITQRLRSALPSNTSTPDFVPFFHPAAIELCSRKVASQTGDLRKAFEILRRAIDLVETETRQKLKTEATEKALQMTPSKRPLGENSNLASPSKASARDPISILASSLRNMTAETAPRVSISHLNKVTAAAFSNGTTQRLKTLNLQQKAALCSLLALDKRNRAALSQMTPTTPSSKSRVTAPTTKTLFETYTLLCKQDSVLHPLSSSEFREVVGSLETLSLVTAVDGKTGSLAVMQTPSKRGRKAVFATGDEKRVASCVGEKDMETAVEGMGEDILRGILSGEALD